MNMNIIDDEKELERIKTELEKVIKERDAYKLVLNIVAEPYWELSHDKVRIQRDNYKKIAGKVLDEYWEPDEDDTPTAAINDDF